MKSIIVLSDLHLGHGPAKEKREEDFIKLLEKIDGNDLMLLGDIFDFWIEYKSVIYKRYLRILCALLKFMERGNRVYFVPGNHDFYKTDFLSSLGINVKKEGIEMEWNGKRVFLHHGDTFSFAGKFNRFLYGNPFTKAVFKLLHPDIGIILANIVSKTPSKTESRAHGFMSRGAGELLKKYDIVITGHTHSPGIKDMGNGKFYVNTGEWIFKRNYLKIDEDGIFLYDNDHIVDILKLTE